MRCIGTPQDLKERYAAAYEISCRLETRDDAHVADLVAFAREAFRRRTSTSPPRTRTLRRSSSRAIDPRRTPARVPRLRRRRARGSA